MFYHWAANRPRGWTDTHSRTITDAVVGVGFAFDTMEEVLLWAERSAAVTHNHVEGIRGAQATAAAIFLARNSKDKKQIRDELELRFGYDLSGRIEVSV